MVQKITFCRRPGQESLLLLAKTCQPAVSAVAKEDGDA